MNWEKINTKTRARQEYSCYVTVLAGDHGNLWLSKGLEAKRGKYDLLRSGNAFALKEAENGQIKVGAKAGGTCALSCGMVRLIRKAYGLSSEKSYRLKAEIEDGMIIFVGGDAPCRADDTTGKVKEEAE